MSGQQFAKWAGIKYTTFASWVQTQRRAEVPAKGEIKPALLDAAQPAANWVEAVMENPPAKKSGPDASCGVMIVEGPGGVRMELGEERRVLGAVKLLRHLGPAEVC